LGMSCWGAGLDQAAVGRPATWFQVVNRVSISRRCSVAPSRWRRGRKCGDIPLNAERNRCARPGSGTFSSLAHGLGLAGEQLAGRAGRSGVRGLAAVAELNSGRDLGQCYSEAREDRLFPGDIEQLWSGGLNLAHGAAGVLLSLATAGVPIDPEHLEWLLRAVPRWKQPRMGFYNGLHGIAYALDRLGCRRETVHARQGGCR
jgi:hypothetical protein